ncbi:MAG: response regulator transcription factor [Anaerolineae bacterium]|nr:response regulator transcription factor [Anaerolineae bacterium]
MTVEHAKDIVVEIASQDPFFIFTTRGLLGRDRRARIFNTVNNLKEIRDDLAGAVSDVHAIILDLGSIADSNAFFEDVCVLVHETPRSRVLCLAEGMMLKQAAENLANAPINALLSKKDLGYCLHLAIRAVIDEDIVLLTSNSRKLLPESSTLRMKGRAIAPHKMHPNLSKRISEIVMWRIFVGLDNPDIQDELLLGTDTVREYVSKAYATLGARGELEAFEAMSDWWWVSRFVPAIT